MKRIYFIRHGESTANAGLPTSDPGTIPLTDSGRLQAAAVADIWPASPSHIICSPFLRTQQTAQPTIDKFPEALQLQWPIHEFTYLSPERCIDTTSEQRRPWVEAYWERADPNFVDGVGAESFSELLGRVNTMFDKFTELPAGSFSATFTHGLFMSAIIFSVSTGFSYPTPESMTLFKRLIQVSPVPNCSLLMCTINDQGRIFLASLEAEHVKGLL